MLILTEIVTWFNFYSFLITTIWYKQTQINQQLKNTNYKYNKNYI